MHDPALAPTESDRRRFRVSPAALVLISFVLLVVVIAIGVAVSARSGDDVPDTLTIAQLQADPDRYDDRTVVLVGRAEDVRALPYISQYALYTFRDETGTIRVLSQKGTPPDDGQGVKLTGVYHARATLDKELRRLVEEEFGPLAGSIVELLLPGVSLNVVFMEHEKYAIEE